MVRPPVWLTVGGEVGVITEEMSPTTCGRASQLVVLGQVWFCPRPPLGGTWLSGDIFGCHTGAGYITGFWWIQTRGTAERPSGHVAVPTRENDQAHSVNSAELEPSWSRGNQANPPTKKVMIWSFLITTWREELWALGEFWYWLHFHYLGLDYYLQRLKIFASLKKRALIRGMWASPIFLNEALQISHRKLQWLIRASGQRS